GWRRRRVPTEREPARARLLQKSTRAGSSRLLNGRRIDDTGDADAEDFPDDDDLALREASVTDVDVDGFASEPLELDHRAAAEPENVLDRHRGATELDRDGQREVHQHRNRHFSF